MDRAELLRYGNELTIKGFIVGSTLETQLIEFPEQGDPDGQKQIRWLDTTNEEIHQIIRQLDTLEIDGLEKVILRKSQRNIDGRTNWRVFKRDGYACVYCGADDVPMTVDHIVLWEHMGDSVEGNMNCSCSKCNKTRGSMPYIDWIGSNYITSRVPESHGGERPDLIDLAARGVIAETLPLRKTKRSR